MLTMLPCRRERHLKSVEVVLEGVWCTGTHVRHAYGDVVTRYNHVLSKCLDVRIETRRRKNTRCSKLAENKVFCLLGICFEQCLNHWSCCCGFVYVQIWHRSPCVSFLKTYILTLGIEFSVINLLHVFFFVVFFWTTSHPSLWTGFVVLWILYFLCLCVWHFKLHFLNLGFYCEFRFFPPSVFNPLRPDMSVPSFSDRMHVTDTKGINSSLYAGLSKLSHCFMQ